MMDPKSEDKDPEEWQGTWSNLTYLDPQRDDTGQPNRRGFWIGVAAAVVLLIGFGAFLFGLVQLVAWLRIEGNAPVVMLPMIPWIKPVIIALVVTRLGFWVMGR